MAINYTQTDTDSGCTTLALCATMTSGYAKKQASDGGTAGTTSVSFSVAGNNPSPQQVWLFDCQVAAGLNWASGTWTVRINVTTANMNITWENTTLCRVSSSCSSVETLGQLTFQGISCSTTGVKTMSVSGSATTPNSGDRVAVELGFINSSMVSQSFSLTPDQNIDSPFAVITPSLVYNHYLRSLLPNLVRKTREFFIGGLPPKLAKLSMTQNDEGLYVPQSSLKGI